MFHRGLTRRTQSKVLNLHKKEEEEKTSPAVILRDNDNIRWSRKLRVAFYDVSERESRPAPIEAYNSKPWPMAKF